MTQHSHRAEETLRRSSLCERTAKIDCLLKFTHTLNKQQCARLIDDIAAIDFAALASLFSNSATEVSGAKLAEAAQAPTTLISPDICERDPASFREALETGWKVLRNEQVGILLVAGSEGTRLGFNHSKEMFPISPVSNKPLFQLFTEQALAISQRAGKVIPYYIMTSDATHEESQRFFRANANFGYDLSAIYFFRQGKVPAVDQKTGQVHLSTASSVAFLPDGHGGLIDAMKNGKVFDDLRRRKIELLYYHQVDNPMARVCDPAFIGFHSLHHAGLSTKIVRKVDPAEKVGSLIEVIGRHHMIEYIDLSPELAAERTEDGSLRLGCGNTAIHLFRCDFLERIASNETLLPYHRSFKKLPFVDE